MLLGERRRVNLGEKCIKAVLKPINWIAPRALSVQTDALARAMIEASRADHTQQANGDFVTNADIHRLAAAYDAREQGK